MYELLKLVEQDARLTCEELATMTGRTTEEVAAQLDEYKKQGILKGYRAIIDWEKTERDFVAAHIELKVIPKKDRGFEELAETISRYDEVESLYLMSGGHDLALTVIGKNFKDIAAFVAYRLAVLDSVQATATHFVLRRYKEKGVILMDSPADERRMYL